MGFNSELADSIRSLAVVEESGLIHFGPLDMYARACKEPEEKVREAWNDALAVLTAEGFAKEVRGSFYAKETWRDWD